jgi:hypothetical protein
VLCAAYSPDGRRIATGGNDNYVWLWDAHTFEPVARLGGHESYVYSLAWRADSQLLVSGSGDHTVRIWETKALKDRMQARRERQDIVARVEPMVQRLFSEFGDAARVAEEVKADTSLSERARQVALQVVLAEAIKARPSTPAQAARTLRAYTRRQPADAQRELAQVSLSIDQRQQRIGGHSASSCRRFQRWTIDSRPKRSSMPPARSTTPLNGPAFSMALVERTGGERLAPGRVEASEPAVK